MRITSKRLLALLLILAVAGASGMDAGGGGGGGRGADEGTGGECDAENANGSCDDTSPHSALDAVEAKVTVAETDNDASPPEGAGGTSVVHVAECADKEPRCAFWASDGECEANPDYMLRELPY